MPDLAIDLQNVDFRWPGASGAGLNVPQLQVPKGEKLLVLGESGSGKSTLLSLICGALAPYAGAVVVNGVDVTRLSAAARDRFRADTIGVIFQQFNLLPFGTVRDNIVLPLRFSRKRRDQAANRREAAEKLASGLGLGTEILSKRAAHLSVGQQQRVAVARALIGHPPIVIADEPTSALDANTQTAFLDLLFAQVSATGATLIMVSHDARLAPLFDRAVDMTQIADIAKGAA